MKIGRNTVPRTAIAASDEDTIVVRGHDLCRDLIGKVSFTEHFFLMLTGRRATAREVAVLDATLVAIAEHGLVPSVQASRMTFAAAPETYDRHVGRYTPALARSHVRLLDLGRRSHVLEVGCGPGALTEALAGSVGGRRVSAVEPSEAFAEACRARVPDADVRVGTAEDLPDFGREFDGATSQLVLDFMSDADAGVASMTASTASSTAPSRSDLMATAAPAWVSRRMRTPRADGWTRPVTRSGRRRGRSVGGVAPSGSGRTTWHCCRPWSSRSGAWTCCSAPASSSTRSAAASAASSPTSTLPRAVQIRAP